MSDLITICIPTHRRPTMLLHCLHSCLTQDYRPLEIDISDNSPTDETRILVESLALPSGVTLRYWRNCPAIGPVENMKKLFASARGRRFVWMNDDDALLPGAVSAMAEAFSMAPDVIAVYGREQLINVAGECLPEQTAYWNAECRRTVKYAGINRDLLVCAFLRQIPHIGFLIQTEVARKIGIRDRSEIGLAADTDFNIRFAQAYRGCAFVFIDREIVQSRLTPSRLSWAEFDVGWKLYDFVASLNGLLPGEASARDEFLGLLAPIALRENALAYRRRAALRILLSRTYLRAEKDLLKRAYRLGLIAMPRVAHAIRRLARHPNG